MFLLIMPKKSDDKVTLRKKKKIAKIKKKKDLTKSGLHSKESKPSKEKHANLICGDLY